MRQISKTARDRDARENAKLEALQETARETHEIRERQDKIIDNQQLLIEYGVAVQKEIMQILIDQEENEQPIREYLADKGGDLDVAAITAATPMIWSGIKAWLATKGIMIP